MKRILLFNSNCSACSQIAHTIKQYIGDWLQIRSLHDKQVQVWLNTEKPGWYWEPMLVLEKDGRCQFLSGQRMQIYFFLHLGPIKAFKLTHLIGQFERETSFKDFDIQRRFFLTQSVSVLGALTLFGLRPLSAVNPQVESNSESDIDEEHEDNGEVYYGFVLMPDVDTPRPAFVNSDKEQNRTRATQFADERALRNEVPFDIYQVSANYNVLPLLSSQLIKDEADESIAGAALNYGEIAYLSEKLESDRLISLWIQNKPYYPSPYPVYPVHKPNFESETITLVPPEKITVGNNYGVMLPSHNGWVAYWFENSVLYTLAVEDSTSRETMLIILNELSTI